MAIIKIISNPYEKEIKYQLYNGQDERWSNIISDSKYNGKLKNEKFRTTFFPYKVKEIVDVIVAEYGAGSANIEIVFEGTGDEYRELKKICKNEKYSCTVNLQKSKYYLENARDILPRIKEVFDSELNLLIEQSGLGEKVENELNKYKEVASNIIPICVLGNYSSGKSTFINALIGCELLPSDAEPLTAKIFKIKQSVQLHKAFIRFQYAEKQIAIEISDNKVSFDKCENENQIIKKISEEIARLEDPSFVQLANKALAILNEDKEVAELIEIEVPFVAGLWGESKQEFVIFDTPGFNSTSNSGHLSVLKNAIKGFSNGIPIFVSVFDSLDSRDNENLYREIKNIEELDDRFTLIVVNRADESQLDKNGFSEEKEGKILCQSVPKNIYSGGIFFVSSVIGLGSKCNGKFSDEHYAEVFDEKKNKFADADYQHYKRLYQFNIMPKQLKQEAVEIAEKNDDILFVNSGLFSVEKEIQTFAEKYTAYDKCQQSKLYLDRIIESIEGEIEEIKNEIAGEKEKIESDFKDAKKVLVDNIKKQSENQKRIYVADYQKYMADFCSKKELEYVVSKEQLSEQEDRIKKLQQEEKGVKAQDSSAKESVDKLKGNLKENWKNALRERNLHALKVIGVDLTSDMQEVSNSYGTLKEIKKEVDKETAENLLEEINNEFWTDFESFCYQFDSESRQYWENKATAAKDAFKKIIAGASVLEEEKIKELEKIIINYGSMEFKNQDVKFNKENYLIAKSDKLNKNKLMKNYNKEMSGIIKDAGNDIQVSHKKSFRNWIKNLSRLIIDNIDQYNPELYGKSQELKEIEVKIDRLEDMHKRLNDCAEAISKMMNWNEA